MFATSQTMFWSVSHAYADGIRYLYDATGNGWSCFWANEQLIMDYDAGVYPDGTPVMILETVNDGLYSQPRHKVQIGRAVGWVLNEELLTQEVWLQKQESCQYVGFSNQWQVNQTWAVQLYTSWRDITMEERLAGQEPSGSFIADVADTTITVLGIYCDRFHIQTSETDGFVGAYSSCLVPNELPEEVGNYVLPIWFSQMVRGIRNVKCENQASWTEDELAILNGLQNYYPNRLWSSARRIIPGENDITMAEAIIAAIDVLVGGGFQEYVSDDTIEQLGWEEGALIFDYTDPKKHIWDILFVTPEDTHFTRCRIQLDAHTKEVRYVEIDGPKGILRTRDIPK
jgi:hypothetical protein